ncbi:MAG: 16S rRNA (cytidine(1402)-2'-O)-methyltransferase [Thermodesulfobacteriota bacterium]|nr:16S rRNA (cytidine(1402)-2'-O)-methyltransferase [Thermodesulfobacteriota bacterium]
MEPAILYIVPTPIGNLRDITLRSLDVLNEVELIVCEDTRHTIRLLNHFNIKKPLIACEKFSEVRKTRELLAMLEKGRSMALVSDAGTPLISDPGAILVNQARQAGIRVEALPGACAAITAFSGSGMQGGFRFIGFFPRKNALARIEIARMVVSEEITIFYESPRRIVKTLDMMVCPLGTREICVARELSKIHEEYISGPIEDVVLALKGMEKIGELTVLVKGRSHEGELDKKEVLARAGCLLSSGYSKKDALSTLSSETGMKRNDLYRLLLDL